MSKIALSVMYNSIILCDIYIYILQKSLHLSIKSSVLKSALYHLNIDCKVSSFELHCKIMAFIKLQNATKIGKVIKNNIYLSSVMFLFVL